MEEPDSCKIITEEEKIEAIEMADKKIVKDDGTGIETINQMLKRVKQNEGGNKQKGRKQKGSKQKGGKGELCAAILATILLVSIAGGVLAFSIACQKYNISYADLEQYKNTLEIALKGCGTVEGVMAREMASQITLAPNCSDVTRRIETVTNDIAALMKTAPSIASNLITGWNSALAAATVLCAGTAGTCKKGGGSKKKNKSKRHRKRMRKTKKN